MAGELKQHQAKLQNSVVQEDADKSLVLMGYNKEWESAIRSVYGQNPSYRDEQVVLKIRFYFRGNRKFPKGSKQWSDVIQLNSQEHPSNLFG